MLIEVITLDWRQSPTNRTRRYAKVSCDQCGTEFEQPARCAKNLHHFCSRRCFGLAHGKAGALYESIRLTNLTRLGVENPSQSEIVKNRKRQTWLAKYGVEHPYQSELVKAKIVTSLQQRYGVSSPMQSSVIRRKAREGMKHWTSKIERQFGLMLREIYNDVQSQVWVNDWSIDFYIPSIDTYVQFDGVYWHGLDRSIEEIAQHKSARDVTIHYKYLIDRKQEQWFQAQGLRLLRITDRDFKKMSKEKLVEALK